MCAAKAAALPISTATSPTSSTAFSSSAGTAGKMNATTNANDVNVAALNDVGAVAAASTTKKTTGAAAGAAGAIQKTTVFCRYYLRGICHFGSMCRFSHDVAAASSGGELISSSDTNAASNNAANASTSAAAAASASKQLTNWINAPAFVPSCKKTFNYDDSDNDVAATVEADADVADAAAGNKKTWAEIVGGENAANYNNNVQYSAPPGTVDILCPYESPCPYGDGCAYTMHMELCKMCDMYLLHPCDVVQRRKHNQACLLQHEKDMELSFAIARSRDKTCGICMDIIVEKQGREKRFGILPNCTHIYCLECIRKWRQAKQFEHKITRSCPECRIASDFVCPSAFWVETKEEKEKLLSDYRAALGVKDCKYFKMGSGKCPFGNKCFYKHALANGELVDVGLPRRSRRVLHQTDDLLDLLDIYLWEFVDQRNFNYIELLSINSDLSEDSDFGE